ncbi:glycerol-3-phosphate acyltransferase 3 isoform X1 [Drosophila guanche]|uniref:Blast:Glycerol-3-phosphate acyltransferase 3 n=1 Tax=Drosophila guanche TaxID=7266 RepID=A0A3B0JKR7_DROGU|nr:glycerol-3-phosphate acyltransferase 3 isoform X1 [Drosophila guanche]SPP73231.1 blast:Glycerol-3-phosphate acyltransferase 3 [Drosophila guanche]
MIFEILNIFWIPFAGFISFLIIISAINKSIGVRRAYVNLLLRIFEYGRVSIETASKEHKQNNLKTDDKHSDEFVDNADSKESTNGTTLITRDAVLLPQPQEPAPEKPASSKKEEIVFDFEKCLDYLKSGVESIIEDDVTSRFEAEELKSWNMLTRTNRHHEFISWKITLIWMVGFFIRYVFLMPLRVLVCFVGVLFAVLTNSIVALIPNRFLRLLLADLSFKITFRLIASSLSSLIKFHNKQYRPTRSGFCVANHTSPLDVAILSTDRTFSLVVWLTVCTAAVGYLKDGQTKRDIVNLVLGTCFGVLSSAISAVITYHNEENRPLSGICVANHTSPIDVLVLMCDSTYSLIGQRHGGFLGVLQRALARASPHIWFERGEAKDRHLVAERLKQHVSDPNNPPILIFPEGTCINNTSVMQFKKGSFEVGGVIYPVAIKYDPRFGDAFWNSAKYSMMQYLYMMMTSWAIVCDVWYLPPMYRQDGESAIDFANRVKGVIAKQGGLIDLVWDGQLKRMKPKKEWKEIQQVEFANRLKAE